MASIAAQPPSKPVQPLVKMLLSSNALLYHLIVYPSIILNKLIQVFHFKFTLRLPAHVFLGNVLALIIELLTAGKRNLNFY